MITTSAPSPRNPSGRTQRWSRWGRSQMDGERSHPPRYPGKNGDRTIYVRLHLSPDENGIGPDYRVRETLVIEPARVTRLAWIVAFVLVACGHAAPGGGRRRRRGREPAHDASTDSNAGGGDDSGGAGDDGNTAAPTPGAPMAARRRDGRCDGDRSMRRPAPITGGPCISGARGRDRVSHPLGGNGAGSTAYPVYEVNGLPDHSRDHAGAYGYQIGFTPSFVDPFLGDGGLSSTAATSSTSSSRPPASARSSQRDAVDLRPQLQHDRERQLQLADVRRRRRDADELRQQRRAVPVVLGRHDDRDRAGRHRRADPDQGRPELRLPGRQPHRALHDRELGQHRQEVPESARRDCPVANGPAPRSGTTRPACPRRIPSRRRTAGAQSASAA